MFTQPPRKTHGFTLIELLVVISIIALLIGILLPALGAARSTARRMINASQLRGIQQGLVVHSQGNRGWYSGINSSGTGMQYDGVAVPSGDSDYGAVGNMAVTTRMAILLNGNYFSADTLISPSETVDAITEGQTDQNLTTDNLSYVALQTGGSPNSGNSRYRFVAWSDTTNSQAPIMSDRNGVDAPPFGDDRLTTSSIHVTTTTAPSSNPEDWQGNVTWNDGHVTFETDSEMDTTRIQGRPTQTNDNLFDGNNTNTDDFSMQYN